MNQLFADLIIKQIISVLEQVLISIPTVNRCEVRPGPEFLVRRYEIFSNGSFVLRQVHYSDRDCARRPEFSVSATGRLRLERRYRTVLIRDLTS